MPFALIIIGVILLIAASRGTTGGATGLFALLQSDFTGQNNFVYWMAAILIIGAIGYIPKVRPISTALLGLVLAVLFLKNANTNAAGGGFFSQLTAGLASTTTTTSTTAPASPQRPLNPNSLFSQFFSGLGSAMGLNPNLGLSTPTTTPAPATTPVNPMPSLFPAPAAGTAPMPTLSQLGALGTTNILVQ